MLVDNAIVVIESIFRNQEKGLSIKEAAINGTAEVANAVIASTLTTIVLSLIHILNTSSVRFGEICASFCC